MEQALYVYETPDTWGSETVYGDRDAIEQTIASLIDAGGPDWASITIDDCEQWAHVDSIGPLHIYSRSTRRAEQFIVLSKNGGLYSRVGTQYDSEDEAREFIADLQSAAARALRAIPSEARSAASRANGKRGGRPRKVD